MTLTLPELGRRLREARQAVRLRREDVAERLDISRRAVAHIEAGRRPVSGLELEGLAQLYGRDMRDFFSESFSARDAVAVLFRQHPEFAGGQSAAQALRTALTLGRAVTGLERLLGSDRDLASIVRHAKPRPRGKREAARQGEAVADRERRRLGLGDQPLPDLVELLELQGVLAVECQLPAGVSGLTLMDPGTGALVVVQAGESRSERRFSVAHEYGHVLLDREQQAVVSRAEERDALPEVRASAFAASFLMPREGVLRFVRTVAAGMDSPERVGLRRELGPPVPRVESRAASGCRPLEICDAALLAHHFGVSQVTAIRRLRNLRVIRRREMDRLLRQERRGASGAVARLRRLVAPDSERPGRGFRRRFLSLGIEALRREQISHARLTELAGLVGMDARALGTVLRAAGLERPPVDAMGTDL